MVWVNGEPAAGSPECTPRIANAAPIQRTAAIACIQRISRISASVISNDIESPPRQRQQPLGGNAQIKLLIKREETTETDHSDPAYRCQKRCMPLNATQSGHDAGEQQRCQQKWNSEAKRVAKKKQRSFLEMSRCTRQSENG